MKKQQKLSITIGHLYADLMNIYGDNGNIITLRKRLEWRGIDCKVLNIGLKETLKAGLIDLYFFGGGQDQAQGFIAEDLVGEFKAEAIKSDIERGVPLLCICGGYQLLGEYYKPHKGPKLEGLGIFPVYTEASHDRMIGNIVVETSNLAWNESIENVADSKLVGFENHSGKTYLKNNADSLGKVIKGFGNNGADKTEGCIYKNTIGCYLHGSVLPKNPQLADWLINKALEIKYGEKVNLEPLDDELEIKAHNFTVSKYG